MMRHSRPWENLLYPACTARSGDGAVARATLPPHGQFGGRAEGPSMPKVGVGLLKYSTVYAHPLNHACGSLVALSSDTVVMPDALCARTTIRRPWMEPQEDDPQNTLVCPHILALDFVRACPR